LLKEKIGGSNTFDFFARDFEISSSQVDKSEVFSAFFNFALASAGVAKKY
jgi:hypothetical protein